MITPLKITGLGLPFPKCVIPTERLKGATRNLELVPRSIDEPEVPTGDPHVAIAPQDDLFGRLIAPSKITGFEFPFLPNLSFRQSD